MAEDLIGKTIGGYEILRQIGQGGMAAVYLARQMSMNREVALKVLPRQFLNDNTYLQRFEQEVAIVSKLEHRNIVPVYDYGEFDGQPFIVMRFLPGGSLDDLIRRGPLQPEKMLHIVSQIAPALDFAHGKNILHRDLKPSNVLMDDDGGAFIADFGIARILGQQGPAITTQGVVGTPSYMSPEQAQALQLDGRSDLYSVGVMLFEMATGRRPFESDTPYSIAVMQVTKQPPAPRLLNPNVSVPLENVILRSLRKRAEDRYETASELAETLKMAIERPHLMHDTEPKMRRPEVIHAAPPPAPPVQQISPPPIQPVYQPTPQSNMMQSVPPSQYGLRRKVKSKSRASVMLSVMLGGLLGCALLAAVVVVVAVTISTLTNDATPTSVRIANETDIPATEMPDANGVSIATLDATSEAARQTLVARSQELAVTETPGAEIQITDVNGITTPIGTPAGGATVLPVGVRGGTPELDTALRSSTGTILFFDERDNTEEIAPARNFEIVKINLDNWIETQLTQDFSTNSYPAAAPDGQWVVFQSDRDNDFEIYVVNEAGGQLRQLTNNTVTDRLPWWSPDGEWIVYSHDTRSDGMFDLYKIHPDGTENQLVFSNGYRNSHARYSADGRYLVFTTGSNPNRANTWEIGLLDLQTNEFKFLTQNNVRDSGPAFHPDGQTILYVTFNNNDLDIAVMDLDGSDQRILLSKPSNEWSANYSPDGAFIVFTSTIDQTDQLFLMTADGQTIQQITTTGGAYASWIP